MIKLKIQDGRNIKNLLALRLALYLGFSSLFPGLGKEEITFDKNITYEDLAYLIDENENFTEEEKKYLKNRNLLEDVLSCYGEKTYSSLEDRFVNLHYSYYTKEEVKGKKVENMIGCVVSSKPNEINILKDLDKKIDRKTKNHEYIHILDHSKYLYLCEACAELYSYEYYGDDIVVYLGGVSNLKLLMETIGPEPIRNVIFANDDKQLVGIITSNLNEIDAQDFLTLLCKNPEKVDNNQIKDYIKKLYESLYYEKFEDNIYIKSILNGKLHDRYYFNEEKINSVQPYYTEPCEKLNIFRKYKAGEKLSYDEYINCPNKEELTISCNLYPGVVREIKDDKLIYYDGKTESFDDAIADNHLDIFYPEYQFDDYDDLEVILQENKDIVFSIIHYYFIDGEYISVSSERGQEMKLEYAEEYNRMYLQNIYCSFPEQKLKKINLTNVT